MCRVAFTAWLYLAEDRPPVHRGAAIARSLGITVDGDRLGANLAAPLTFADGEIDCFIRDNACSIHRSHLTKFPAAGRKWTANCLECGPIMAHNYVRKSTLERVAGGDAAARYELSEPSQSTNPLKDLGY